MTTTTSFSESANARLIDSFVRLTRLEPGARVIDLGCGSGTFTYLLSRRGYEVAGLDISPKLLELARSKYPDLDSTKAMSKRCPTRTLRWTEFC